MYCILEDSSTLEDSGPLSPRAIANRIREFALQLIKAKKQEFTQMNANLFKAVAILFSALEPIYIQEKKLVDIRASATVTLPRFESDEIRRCAPHDGPQPERWARKKISQLMLKRFRCDMSSASVRLDGIDRLHLDLLLARVVGRSTGNIPEHQQHCGSFARGSEPRCFGLFLQTR